MRLVALSGVCAGLAVACKLSNGPLAMVLPALWAMGAGGWRLGMARMALGCVTVLLGFIVAYAPWGWQLWEQFGNPIYPFEDNFFEPLRAASGWTRP